MTATRQARPPVGRRQIIGAGLALFGGVGLNAILGGADDARGAPLIDPEFVALHMIDGEYSSLDGLMADPEIEIEAPAVAPVAPRPADPVEIIWWEFAAQGIPPRDIGGMIGKARCESGFNPWARPRGIWGPSGLFQIIPLTYNDLARRYPGLGLPLVDTSHADNYDPRLDPWINARAAARLFLERGYQPWTVGGC